MGCTTHFSLFFGHYFEAVSELCRIIRITVAYKVIGRFFLVFSTRSLKIAFGLIKILVKQTVYGHEVARMNSGKKKEVGVKCNTTRYNKNLGIFFCILKC